MSPKGSRNEGKEKRIRAIPNTGKAGIALIAALVAAVCYLATASASTEAPLVSAPATHLGKTAAQWHQRAVLRTQQRNATRAKLRHARAETAHVRASLRQTLSADLYGTHWIERAFLCIHAGEGSWTDPNAPYYGGLQMDMSFQRAYGSEYLAKFGTADNWPVSVQLAVAVKAYLSGRGFYPWPNTARMCGLIS